MYKRISTPFSGLVLSLIVVALSAHAAQAARWKYHSLREDQWTSVWIYGTKNCRVVTEELRRFPLRKCKTHSGFLPLYANDWLVKSQSATSEQGPTRTKFVAQPCPESCWKKEWRLGPVHEYLEDYIPLRYGVDEIVLPGLCDPYASLPGQPWGYYVLVDLGKWLDGGATFVDPGPDVDPNTIYFDFVDGNCPTLPGFTVAEILPGLEEPFVFNPQADPNSYPIEVVDPALLFTGRLYLQAAVTFDSEPYNTYLMAADNNYDGVVDLIDFARYAKLYLQDVNTVGPECVDADADGYGLSYSPLCTHQGLDCNGDNGLDDDCDGLIDAEDPDCTASYSHTIIIDGSKDFVAAETFATSTVGHTGYFSWDSSYLYLGMEGAQVGSANSNIWLLLYIGGSPGATTGMLYNTQQPGLPFSARYHIRWNAGSTNTDAQQFNGATWTDTGWDFTGDVYQTGDYIEMRIPLADIGSPAAVSAHLSMTNETVASEWTFAGVPSTSFSDAYDPDYSSYFQFDLTAASPPGDYSPLP
ncbi:MAG: hypothetical protein ACYTBJ_19325 [Planctomycetota bacterium]|jgi:hypothetical protein